MMPSSFNVFSLLILVSSSSSLLPVSSMFTSQQPATCGRPELQESLLLAPVKKFLDLLFVAAASSSLLITAPDQAAVARLTAVSAPLAGTFLHAVPITSRTRRSVPSHCYRSTSWNACLFGASLHLRAVVDDSGIVNLSYRKSADRLAIIMLSMS
jgi:hypothetical protein